MFAVVVVIAVSGGGAFGENSFLFFTMTIMTNDLMTTTMKTTLAVVEKTINKPESCLADWFEVLISAC